MIDNKWMTVCPVVPDVAVGPMAKAQTFSPKKFAPGKGFEEDGRLFLQRLVEDKQYALLAEFGEKAVSPDEKFRVLRNLSGYLSELKVECAVIEHEYVDKDYLEDYSRYYSRCHQEYKRWCHRIHFFSGDLGSPGGNASQEQVKVKWQRRIEAILSNPDGGQGDAAFRAVEYAYLGFVVIRPLATAIVGRTCLKVYPPEDGVVEGAGQRCYKALADVPVQFFGRRLMIRSMPFLQQDSTTAACASCALWSAHLVTAQAFHRAQYSPGCITSLATEHGMYEGQSFPNKSGLYDRDMVYAIRRLDLEPICFGGGFFNDDGVRELATPDGNELVGRIYAYLSVGLPIILAGDLYYYSKGDGDKHEERVIGRHAVTVNGYHMKASNPISSGSFKSERVDKIYVHDDQVGPEARIFCEGETWISDWTAPADSAEPKVYMRNLAIVIPAYQKMRVNYAMIVEQVQKMKVALEGVFALDRIKDGNLRDAFKLAKDKFYDCNADKWEEIDSQLAECDCQEWDIRLQTCDAFKSEIRNDKSLLGYDDFKLRYIAKGYPKYFWNVGFAIRNEKGGSENVLRFVVDATDTGIGLRVIDVIQYSNRLDLVWGFWALVMKNAWQCVPLLMKQALTNAVFLEDEL